MNDVRGPKRQPKKRERMALTATGVHGHALTVETPANRAAINHQGCGTDLLNDARTPTSFDIPISIPVLINNVRAKLVCVSILFEMNSGDGFISILHVLDGVPKSQEFNDLHFEGSHWTGLEGANTFCPRSRIASLPESASAFNSSRRLASTALPPGPGADRKCRRRFNM